mmetsp:Transcript_62029/g.165000  ORF Transcript_62029/g.165000 Transcript_62029/m.165000 type:complete len:322 (-) Transcript_62029:134-1099(-)
MGIRVSCRGRRRQGSPQRQRRRQHRRGRGRLRLAGGERKVRRRGGQGGWQGERGRGERQRRPQAQPQQRPQEHGHGQVCREDGGGQRDHADGPQHTQRVHAEHAHRGVGQPGLRRRLRLHLPADRQEHPVERWVCVCKFQDARGGQAVRDGRGGLHVRPLRARLQEGGPDLGGPHPGPREEPGVLQQDGRAVRAGELAPPTLRVRQAQGGPGGLRGRQVLEAAAAGAWRRGQQARGGGAPAGARLVAPRTAALSRAAPAGPTRAASGQWRWREALFCRRAWSTAARHLRPSPVPRLVVQMRTDLAYRGPPVIVLVSPRLAQ